MLDVLQPPLHASVATECRRRFTTTGELEQKSLSWLELWAGCLD